MYRIEIQEKGASVQVALYSICALQIAKTFSRYSRFTYILRYFIWHKFLMKSSTMQLRIEHVVGKWQ